MKYQGEVRRSRPRESGTLIILLDRENGGDWVDADDRWVTLCDEHAATCSHTTLKLACAFMASPGEWCSVCGDHEGLSYEQDDYAS